MGLTGADHNYKLLNPEWCQCSNVDHDMSKIAYYRSAESGMHGWMCTICRGIVQTG